MILCLFPAPLSFFSQLLASWVAIFKTVETVVSTGCDQPWSAHVLGCLGRAIYKQDTRKTQQHRE